MRPIITSATDLGELPSRSVNVVFAANFFEHLSREQILDTLHEAHRVLDSGRKASGAAAEHPAVP